MILSGQSIRKLRPIEPFCERTQATYGDITLSHGLGPAGYDVRVAEGLTILPGTTRLASTVEKFTMPDFCMAIVHDKSTWGRKGLAVQNTVIEPGWRGYLTLELSYTPLSYMPVATMNALVIPQGAPIAQIVFHLIDGHASYDGKYQDQLPGPQQAR